MEIKSVPASGIGLAAITLASWARTANFIHLPMLKVVVDCIARYRVKRRILYNILDCRK